MGTTTPGTIKAPQISVCMPVYNGAWCLGAALESVLTQTFQDFEILIFDDASTDGTWGVLESVQDPRVRCHRNPRNIGAEANWNQCLQAATGTYIKIFHQDDKMAPDCLKRQLDCLELDPRRVLAFCRRSIIDSDGRRLGSRGAPWKEGEVEGSAVARGCVLRGTNLVGEPSAVLFRARAAREAGFFDGSIPYLIDLDYWVRILVYGPGYYLDDPLVSFRVSNRQWSVALGNRQTDDFIRFIDRIAGRGIYRPSIAARAWARWMARMNGWARAAFYMLFC